MSKDNKRLNLSLPSASAERLEDLRKRTGAASVTEVVRHALVTYESLADHLEAGSVFFARKPDGEMIAVEFLIDTPRKPRPDLRAVPREEVDDDT